KTPDFSNQVLQFIDTTINYTKEMMGATDAALGNIKPDNTSAIIAVQQSTAVPLENQRLAYYDFLEETVRIYIDIMASDYGSRVCQIDSSALYSQEQIQALEQADKQLPQRVQQTISFDDLKLMNYELNVDIGASSYWSETIQTTQLDNLYSKGIITDPVAFLEAIPEKQLKGKQKLIESAKESSQVKQQLEMLSSQNQQLIALLKEAGIKI
ncbi:MAG: hypothetical protein J6K75_08930, partial [Erysipelotrichaceae bacterium]|nr:hypothetical protein [Erysipelotrichaceae bacterium]